jgi:threonine dehydratase
MASTLEIKDIVSDGQPSLNDLETAAALIYKSMPPTPQYRWPLLEARAGTTVWVKHENHTPVGGFKIRGGLVYMDELCRVGPKPGGVISAEITASPLDLPRANTVFQQLSSYR